MVLKIKDFAVQNVQLPGTALSKTQTSKCQFFYRIKKFHERTDETKDR